MILLKSSIFFYKKCTNKVLVDFYSDFFFPLGVTKLILEWKILKYICIKNENANTIKCTSCMH